MTATEWSKPDEQDGVHPTDLAEDGWSEDLGLGDDVRRRWRVLILVGREGPLYGGEGVAQFLPRPPGPSPFLPGGPVGHVGDGAVGAGGPEGGGAGGHARPLESNKTEKNQVRKAQVAG